ncbi:KpsF/GutQ family sugar-phosphate isomerase [Stratiformator vulcanicus]|uniref:Arabinose 5-phosphate isomerase KdsD n=1 Tax=Stratiformator vulcanicus TaxID=2527980 RepID=A0A517QYR0_9PLAN|nr:KpsF/GutQ family sugar-phosphate isomerase [Stratiformator vulcanicus]QDT36680.1 Arabinose 5-phosphate isomerase KdsD [Stratiformator vulcanicus]
MSAAARSVVPFDHVEQLRSARDILRVEANALESLASRLDTSFCAAVDLIDSVTGSVIVTGIGKAGLVGQKIAASLSSLGIRAHVLHPAEAVHGDLGCVHEDDVVIALSHSGETDELNRLLPLLDRMGVPVVAVTASAGSTLGAAAQVTIEIGKQVEVDDHNLAPTTSTTVMIALGDALAVTLSRRRGFTPQRFALFHPGGSLGRRLSRIKDVMRTGEELRISSQNTAVRDVLAESARPGRRTGAVMLVDDEGLLTGLFTDSDLARLLERREETRLDEPISSVMTHRPITVTSDRMLEVAVEILSARKLSELPVVDSEGRPVGLIDVTDVLGLVPEAEHASSPTHPTTPVTPTTDGRYE